MHMASPHAAYGPVGPPARPERLLRPFNAVFYSCNGSMAGVGGGPSRRVFLPESICPLPLPLVLCNGCLFLAFPISSKGAFEMHQAPSSGVDPSLFWMKSRRDRTGPWTSEWWTSLGFPSDGNRRPSLSIGRSLPFERMKDPVSSIPNTIDVLVETRKRDSFRGGRGKTRTKTCVQGRERKPPWPERVAVQQHLDPMEWKGKERKERWKDQDQAGHLSTWIHLLCQAASLLLQLVWTMLMAVRFVLLRTMDAAAGRWAETPTPTATHYEGYVTHQRIQPLQHNLKYPVRVCCVDLDCPPPWFQEHKKLAKTMSAGEAREKAGTNGRVLLLTQPSVAGYVMNPISIYFCYQKGEDAIASNRGVPQDGARKRASEPSGNALASTNNDAMQDERRSRGEKDPGEALPHVQKQGNKDSANDPDLQHLKIGLAEVTNTPWGARVTFAFDPHGRNNAPFSLGSGPCPASVERQTRGDKRASEDHESMQFRKEVRAPTPKCLHVSPFMDMKSGWVLKARLETDTVCVSVGVKHPEMGDYFVAELRCQKSGDPHRRNEYSSWRNLLKYGFMPHRVAWWIYWHAAVLLWKGVPFVAPPSKAERAKRVESCAWPTLMANGHRLEWEDPTSFPWQSDL